MFVSFFPRPLVFAVLAALWGAFAIGLWYRFGSQVGELLGFHVQASGPTTMGAAVFWSSQFLWFYLYFHRDSRVVRSSLDAFISSPACWRWNQCFEINCIIVMAASHGALRMIDVI
jgi:ABC-type long-subunit fatty acid transport system fused permease/ATPase subunit